MVPAPRIITCREWKARPPKRAPQIVARPDKIIIHHTDGHGPLTVHDGTGSLREAIAYAVELQRIHMDRNLWNDSGHNFLVMRSGIILQGRWGTVDAIEHGRMVESAHCPGQNGNPGIEHEHLPGELLTKEQRDATVSLMAWICDRCNIAPTALYGHGVFYPTECPSNLSSDILPLRLLVARKLQYYGRSNSRSSRILYGSSALRRERKS